MQSLEQPFLMGNKLPLHTALQARQEIQAKKQCFANRSRNTLSTTIITGTHMKNNSNMIKLLPDHDYKINCHHHDGKQFVSIFRNTWKKIPYKVRRAILKYWRESNWPVGFELSNMWGSGYDPKLSAQVRHEGCLMKFRQSDFEVLPEKVAEFLIAHELAHVYQKACGRRPGGESEEENENHANHLASSWGFYTSLYYEWCQLMSERGMSFEEACKKIQDEYHYPNEH